MLISILYIDHSVFGHTNNMLCSYGVEKATARPIWPAAYHPASHCWLVSEAKQGWSQEGRPAAAGREPRCCWKWCWRASRRHLLVFILFYIYQCPRAVIGDIALCRVLSFGWVVKWVSVVTKDPMAHIIRVGVLTLVSWLNSQSGPHTIMVT